MEKCLASIGSDVFFVPTPLIRADVSRVVYALEAAKEMISEARHSPHFMMYGIHLLIDDKIFRDDNNSRRALSTLLDGVSEWYTLARMENIFVSFKIGYTTSRSPLFDPNLGQYARQSLSDFIVELRDSVSRFNGTLVAHNWWNWALGILDSGADIVSCRVSGPMDIEKPIRAKAGKTGAKSPPSITVPRSMVDTDYLAVQSRFNNTGGFPTPSCLTPEAYWNFKYFDQLRYVARARCGTFIDLGHEYRDAGLDPKTPLGDAVRSLVGQSGIRQDLMDLCPSL